MAQSVLALQLHIWPRHMICDIFVKHLAQSADVRPNKRSSHIISPNRIGLMQ